MAASSVLERGLSDEIYINKIINFDLLIFNGLSNHSATDDDHVVWK